MFVITYVPTGLFVWAPVLKVLGLPLNTLVQLGIALGLETIAEGVETREQRRLLLAENVDSGQGFLFAQPLDVGAIDQLLNDWGGGTDEV